MIRLEEAIKWYKKNFPNKRLLGVDEYNGKYVFGGRDKSLKDDEPNWDSTLETIDKETGEISDISAFDLDYMENAKTLISFSEQ